ncbi:MAG: ABC transporter permease [Pyrinomonadaceae bacterium]
MQTLWQDIRYGARMLLKHKGFTLIAIIALALGIGANTAVFSVLHTVLLRPLPFREADTLISLQAVNQSIGVRQGFLSQADVLDIRRQSQSFEQIASWVTAPLNLSGTGRPERLEGMTVSTNFFQTLGVQPLLGRGFSSEDASVNSNSVIIGYGLWRRQFGGDPNLIGRKISLGGDADVSIVVGIMPAGFDFPQRAEVWMPYEIDPANTSRGGYRNERAFARLKRGVTIQQAQAELHAIAQNLARQYPNTNAGWDVTLVSLREYLFGGAKIGLPLLFGAACFVLLIACTNVANLQLARAAVRQREIAIRLALGAGRARIIRQLLTESLLLAVLGGALGLLLAAWMIDALRSLGPDSLPRLKEATLNAPVLWFTALVSILTGLIFGLVPAWQAARTDLNESLKDGGMSNTNAPHRNRLRMALVVSQVTLALVLLIGAGLLIKSFWRLQQVSPGFEPENILVAGVALNNLEYPFNDPRRIAYFRQAAERLAALPGVESVGAISHLPLGGREMSLPFQIKGQSRVAGKVESIADIRIITPSYFDTLRIPLKSGRVFGEQETKQPLFVVNDSFAHRFFPGGDAIGQRLAVGSFGFDGLVLNGEIVGITGDVKARGLEAEARPEIYLSYLHNSMFPIMQFVVRTSADPLSIAEAVRRELQDINPHQVVYNVKPLRRFLTDSTAQRRFTMLLLVTFTALAVVLAAVGIYGVMNYTVAQRTHEIGIRIALGAQGRDVLRLVLKQGLMLVVSGIALGLLAAVLMTRLISSLLFGISATDPVTFMLVPLLLIVVALLACYIPARRATKVDPMIALRYE